MSIDADRIILARSEGVMPVAVDPLKMACPMIWELMRWVTPNSMISLLLTATSRYLTRGRMIRIMAAQLLTCRRRMTCHLILEPICMVTRRQILPTVKATVVRHTHHLAIRGELAIYHSSLPVFLHIILTNHPTLTRIRVTLIRPIYTLLSMTIRTALGIL